MLYRKSAVKKPAPVTQEQWNLARRHHPFRLSREERELLPRCVSPLDRTYLDASHVAFDLDCRIKYDRKHEFVGTRTAAQVLEHRKGHCLEKTVLLYAALREREIPTSWLLVKNHVSHHINRLTQIGIHPLLVYHHGKIDYVVDAVGGDVRHLNLKSAAMCSQRLSFREFVAFYLDFAADDYTVEHQRPVEGLALANLAGQIDPNNYVIDITRARSLGMLGKVEQARAAFETAIAKAPLLADPRAAYADFLYGIDPNGQETRDACRAAALTPTLDFQVMTGVEQQLRALGEFGEADRLCQYMAELIFMSEERADYCGKDVQKYLRSRKLKQEVRAEVNSLLAFSALNMSVSFE